jgi:hypothetical protein
VQEKSEKFSVSFPGLLLAAMDEYIGSKPRSRYLQELATRDLRSVGALKDDPVAAELERTRELIETRGIAAVRAKHDELIAQTIETPQSAATAA